MRKIFILIVGLFTLTASAIGPFPFSFLKAPSGGGGGTTDYRTNLAAEWIADTTTGSDATEITSWADTSGNSVTATTSSGFGAARYGGIVNGHAILRFNGTGSEYTASLARSHPSTVVIVYKSTLSGDGYLMDGQASNAAMVQVTGSNGTQRVYAGSILDKTGVTLTSFVVGVAVFNGSSSVSAVNGSAASGDAGTTDATSTTIGRNGGGASGYFQGDIAEIRVYSEALSGTNRGVVENYLRVKYTLY